MLNRLRVAALPQRFRNKRRLNRGILTGRCKEDPLGDKISKYWHVVVPFAPVYLVGSYPYHVSGAQPGMRRFHVGEEHPAHPRVTLAEDLAGALHCHLPHQGHGQGLELLGEVLATPLPGQNHTVHLPVVATASTRHGTDDKLLLVEDVEMPLVHRLDMVVAGHRGPAPRALFRPQLGRLFDLQYERRGACLHASFDYTPNLPKPQQLSVRVFRCHRPV